MGRDDSYLCWQIANRQPRISRVTWHNTMRSQSKSKGASHHLPQALQYKLWIVPVEDIFKYYRAHNNGFSSLIQTLILIGYFLTLCSRLSNAGHLKRNNPKTLQWQKNTEIFMKLAKIGKIMALILFPANLRILINSRFYSHFQKFFPPPHFPPPPETVTISLQATGKGASYGFRSATSLKNSNRRLMAE